MEDPRSFIATHEAWYAKHNPRSTRGEVAEVMFGLYPEDGGTSGEMALRWYPLTPNAPPNPRLEVFDDAWAVLATMPDVLAWLAEHDSKDPSPADFMDALRSMGFRDHTQREDPDGNSGWSEVVDRRKREELAAVLDTTRALLERGAVTEARHLLSRDNDDT